MISWLSDIIALWYHLFLWYHVTCAGDVCWLLLLKLPLQLETSPSQVQVEAPHWQWAWSQCLVRTAQVGHLVMASFSQVHSQSVRSPGQPEGSQESGQGVTQWLAAFSALSWQLSRKHELAIVHLTAWELLIVTLPHTALLQKYLKLLNINSFGWAGN
jgi:hypothetical protein